MHIPVLLSEVLAAFANQRMRTFLDCTLGLGGHAAAILKKHSEIETYIGCDQDPAALAIAQKNLQPWADKLTVIQGNFSSLQNTQLPAPEGILIDLGVSSLQLDTPERGFSFRFDSPLDMRMNPLQELTAADIINQWSEDEIGRILRDYGEERFWRQASRAIVRAREENPITTTGQLSQVLTPLLRHKSKPGINPLTLVFQGLRIAVNRELEVLHSFLPWAIEALPAGKRLAVISFHSLEDRIVKQAFQWAAMDKVSTSGIGGLFLDKTPLAKIVTRKPITCSEQEAHENPRARSAKLRILEKLP